MRAEAAPLLLQDQLEVCGVFFPFLLLFLLLLLLLLLYLFLFVIRLESARGTIKERRAGKQIYSESCAENEDYISVVGRESNFLLP